MLFAWAVTKHVKSNAIVFAKDKSTVGIGAGQMSRVDAARIAVQKAADTAAHHGWDDHLPAALLPHQMLFSHLPMG